MLEFNVNNKGVLTVQQSSPDATVTVTTMRDGKIENNYTISNGDFVMLLNLYRYIKDHDIQNDFINYHGKNHD